VVAVLAACLALFIFPRTYDGEALVLVSRPRYEVELESKMKSSQEPLSSQAAQNVSAVRSRMDTLALIARSTEVESAVQQRLAAKLPAEELRPGRLVPRIRVRPASELLRITATAGDPELAADLANAWADSVAARVEAIYGSGAGVRAVEAEVERAYESYTAADRALSRFGIDNPIDETTRRLEAKTQEVTLLQALQEQRLGYLRSRALSIHSSISSLDQIIRDAETLRSQLGPTPRSQAAMAGDGLALVMLRARGYLSLGSTVQPGEAAQGRPGSPAPSDGRPAPAADARPQVDARPSPGASMSSSGTVLQIPAASGFTADRPEDRVLDLTNMIQALQERRDALQAEFEELATRLQTGLDPASSLRLPDDDPTEVALRRATLELQEAKAAQTELVRQRDELMKQRSLLATSYETLRNKAQELRVLRATDDSGGVTVAERAGPAANPSSPGPLRFAVAGAVLGLLLGCALALSPLFTAWLHDLTSGATSTPTTREDERAAGVAVP
jgi:uncharacterized protein involved in exopolysaccharide biosynthesis